MTLNNNMWWSLHTVNKGHNAQPTPALPPEYRLPNLEKRNIKVGLWLR